MPPTWMQWRWKCALVQEGQMRLLHLLRRPVLPAEGPAGRMEAAAQLSPLPRPSCSRAGARTHLYSPKNWETQPRSLPHG